jgi:hypothetical protein
MGVDVIFAQGKVPEDVADWARTLRKGRSILSPRSVTPDELAASTTDLIDTTATTAANAAASAAEAAAIAAANSNATTLANLAEANAISAAASALAAHTAAPDPHTDYTTTAELASAIAAHEAAANPHPVYLTQTEGDARYLQLTLSLTNAVDDTAAAAAGVAVGRLYRNGSVVMIRVT